jgi:hypothetical protein
MKIKVKAQPGKVCRLSDLLCVSDKETEVTNTTFVRRRIRDGSLIECKTRGKSK